MDFVNGRFSDLSWVASHINEEMEVDALVKLLLLQFTTSRRKAKVTAREGGIPTVIKGVLFVGRGGGVYISTIVWPRWHVYKIGDEGRDETFQYGRIAPDHVLVIYFD